MLFGKFWYKKNGYFFFADRQPRQINELVRPFRTCDIPGRTDKTQKIMSSMRRWGRPYMPLIMRWLPGLTSLRAVKIFKISERKMKSKNTGHRYKALLVFFPVRPTHVLPKTGRTLHKP